ncbi:MAG: phosphoenolpyruvate carboxylase [Bdellovibrionaceae bacterium]|nr:phosphoenolpyruvate carboxylase [Pseudobdellovibrionaceae bacterium]
MATDNPRQLPEELRHLVHIATAILGDTIRDVEGAAVYRKVESYRRKLKSTRGREKSKNLPAILKQLRRESPALRLHLSRAFSLQLELVNCCEAAYRTWRVQRRPVHDETREKTVINLVLTAHPTEARSLETVRWLNDITAVLLGGLTRQFHFDDVRMRSLVRLLWLRALSKATKPAVTDEADYIFSLALSDDSLNFLLTEHPDFSLRLRTWVGGDKDGHPLIDHRVMRACLQRSRQRILHHLNLRLDRIADDFEGLSHRQRVGLGDVRDMRALRAATSKFSQVEKGDGRRIKQWTERYLKVAKRLDKVMGTHHEHLAILQLLQKFPAIVLPIEMREDSGLVHEALKKKNAAIRQMLGHLARIAGPLEITSYARGFVISHCESGADLTAACDLIKLATGASNLPAIPLFETSEALRGGRDILKAWLSERKNLSLVKKNWRGRFEIMLGYSDSAKQVGVLSSRYLLSKTMVELEQTIKARKLLPIFFHGSGGSVDRGGGSLKEQIQWWADAAVATPKMTVQGEMIQRWFANPEILNSQCSHLADEVRARREGHHEPKRSGALEKFAGLQELAYRELTGDGGRMGQLLGATPYRFLEVLHIGSRPAKRASGEFSLNSLRAIPWVLCWTQTRILWPTWWGLGSAWKLMGATDRQELRRLYRRDPFFSSFLKMLGFTLAKVEMEIWETYFQPEASHRDLSRQIRNELAGARAFLADVTGEDDPLWYRPWLQESIRMRNPHIHILNLLQVLAIEDNDADLMRSTLVGIACGMMTTG